ncbi:hypothetical protein PLICRDRAFT_145764 [Plicaturopsis crispa FD-325 SS-3]|uniref:DNA 3'-5' helicase n=1 Tax=Plicaturopsis crispa FD-325 SS-3 TaxID=944288 RepID=A0A0C9SL94_PLICR|nr:hypothetical protein PLICRDRAFT_145764 [Plicaturopsis crispa FD-325 SS-3]
MEAIEAQLKKKDVLVHAGTGLGKTAIAAGPHAHPSAKGKVTLMVSPLIALHEEMAETFRDEFKLKATAINSSNGGCKAETLEEIITGEWQIVLISPEMLLSRRFTNDVLRKPEFGQRILSVVIDEAHVVSHWGSSFRKKYGELGKIRAFLPRSTPFVALSATLPARLRHDVLTKLQYHKTDYVSIDVGNDRPNVSIVVRGMQHPINTYADLDFIVGDLLVRCPADISKTFIYCDNIATGVDIIDHLTALLPEFLEGAGLVRPYNAAFSKKYRTKVMSMFRDGSVRVLVCTDAAGMGCNIPDVDLVVQWKLPGSVSTFVQRAGRAGRGPGTKGLAVLLVESSAYGIEPEEAKDKIPKGRKKVAKAGQATAPSAGQLKHAANVKKARALLRGAKRGARGGKSDAIPVRDAPKLRPDAADEGLLVLVQTGLCRRAVLTEVYGNKPFGHKRIVPCCDLCEPSLLDRTRPGTLQSVKRASAIKKGLPCEAVQTGLHSWRTLVHRRDFRRALFPASAILKNETLVLLSSVGPFKSREMLKKVLAGQWEWEASYGDELFEVLVNMDIPALVPIPKAPRGRKRAGEDVDASEVPAASSSRAKPRAKTAMTAANTTSVNHGSTEEAQIYVPTIPPAPNKPTTRTQENIFHAGPMYQYNAGTHGVGGRESLPFALDVWAPVFRNASPPAEAPNASSSSVSDVQID